MRIIFEHTVNALFFLLGLMHTALTLLHQRPFDLDALMYVGTGLAFIFLSLFNFSRIKTKDRLTKLLSVLCNVLTLLYLVLISVVFADPRVIIGIAAVLILVVLSVLDYRLALK